MARLPDSDSLYYEAHVFCCTNEREVGHPRGSCKARGGVELREYMKARAKDLGLKGRVRINSAGCLDRCELGPCVVIYPEGIWYGYHTKADVDEILNRHIIKGETVERLVLDKDQREPKSQSLKLKVAAVTDLTPAIKQFDLVSGDGTPLPPFQAGAYITFAAGDAGNRSYSLCGDVTESGRYVIAVQCEDAGEGGSLWMHQKVTEGTALQTSTPVCDFGLSEEADRHLLIAGGIGITPILAMTRELDRRDADFAVHYCARTLESTAFHAEMEKDFGANTTFHFDGGDLANGIDLDAVLGTPVNGTHIYVCGPSGLMDAVIEGAKAKGWPEDAIHSEYFSAPSDPDQVNEPFQVKLATSGRILDVPADKSILEVLCESGVGVESSCESGVCGTCRTGLVGGVADHRDMVLSDEEKSENTDIMVCVSRAKEGEVLVLDL